MDSMRPVKPFDSKVDTSQLASEWRRWKRSLECYLEASGIVGQREKRNQLMYLGGPDLQDIVDGLPGVNEVPHVSVDPPFYDVAIAKLDEHFQPSQRRTYERYMFRQISQQPGERFNDFVMKLRVQAGRCEFSRDGGSVLETMIIDQIAEKCLSAALRKKILEKDRSLEEVIVMGKTIEDVEVQCKEFVQPFSSSKSTDPVNKIVSQNQRLLRQVPRFEQPQNWSALPSRDMRHQYTRVQQRWFNPDLRTKSIQQPNAISRPYQQTPSRPAERDNYDNRTCFACGRRGHLRGNPSCPAKLQECHTCKRVGHYFKWCTKRVSADTIAGPPAKRIKAVFDNQEHRKTESKEEDIAYVMGQNVFKFKIAGIQVPMAIDSGAAANLIDVKTWKQLQREGTKISFETQTDRAFKAYGSETPLELVGMFKAKIEAGENATNAVFYVARNGKQNLLGDDTAKQLKVLKIGYDIGAVQKQAPFPKMLGIVVEIPIDPTVQPVQQQYRRVPFALEEKIANKLQSLLDQDIIERVQEPSPWVSPVVPVLKDNGDIRLCIDMRRANQAVLRETHPLPVVEEMFGGISGATKFSKLDIKDAYHQVEISERSRQITTFITKQGLFRYKRLMFGISCAPELFQKVMESILAGLDGVVVYLDDVMISGKTQAEHDRRLKLVLDRLKEYGILLNEDKCITSVDCLEFVGQELSSKGIRPTESKIEAIQTFREPSNVSELRSFLGLITYVGRFIPNLAEKTEPLRSMLRGGEKFTWTPNHQRAFEEIKSSLNNESFLGYFNPRDSCVLIADASPTGLGAVLIQQDESGTSRIISFASKSLTDLERKYFQTEREALALVWGVDKFKLYLLGRKFKLVTDCKPLHYLFKQRAKPCARIERWVLRLQAYNFEVVYEPGATNLADALSRLSRSQPIEFDVAGNACIYQLIQFNAPNAMSLQEIETQSSQDETIEAVRQSLETGIWCDKSRDFKQYGSELCSSGKFLLRGDRLVIPENLRQRTLEIAHESHPGIVVMKRRLRQKVWWPLMDKQVEAYVRKCKPCTLVSALDPPEPMNRTAMPENAWVDIAADFVGPLPSGHNLLVLVDYFSRFTEVVIMKQITAAATVRALHEVFCRFGVPQSLKTDNGPQFVSKELSEFCEQFGIEHRRTTPYWPQANGEVERINRTIKKRLMISQETEGSDWQWDLRMFILMQNSTPHSTTAVAPSTLMFGRVLRDKLPGLMTSSNVILEEITDQDKTKKMKGAEYGDRRRRARASDVEVGDTVVTRRVQKDNKLSTTFGSEEYSVIDRTGSDVTLESNESGRKIHRNTSHVKKLVGNGDADEISHGDQLMKRQSGTEGLQATQESRETEKSSEAESRPRREPKRPVYLNDYKI